MRSERLIQGNPDSSPGISAGSGSRGRVRQTLLDRLWAAANAAAAFAQQHQPDISQGVLGQQQFLEAYRTASAALIYETHFYFVAWYNCEQMLGTLVNDPAFMDARKVFNSHEKMLHHYKNARHSFEHFAERLPGGKEESKVVEVVQGADREHLSAQAPKDGVEGVKRIDVCPSRKQHPIRLQPTLEGLLSRHADRSAVAAGPAPREHVGLCIC